MRYKSLKWGILLSGIFGFLWLHLNRNYLPRLDELGMQGMIYLASGYAGYNCILSHGSIYAMMFVFMLQDVLHKDSIQILIRMKRKSYISFLYKDIISASLRYSIAFLGVMVVLTMLFESKQMIYDSGFLIGVGILLVYLVLYYFF